MGVDVIYTDAAHVEVGVLDAYELDVDVGKTDDFELKVGARTGPALDVGAWVYVEGTEWGGRVDAVGVDTEAQTITYTGRTWRGMLAERVLRPSSGDTHWTFGGDANTAIQRILTAHSVPYFAASETEAGVTVSGTADRYCTIAEGLDKMLGAVGMRLGISHDADGTVLTAVAGHTDAEPYEASSDEASFEVSGATTVNHLVCLGKDTGTSRVVVDLYADAAGTVSSSQSITGEAEVEEVYEYSSEDSDEITEDGTKKLAELQETGEASMDLSTGEALALHDVVRAVDELTGIAVLADVDGKVMRVNRYGLSYEYTMGEVREASAAEAAAKAAPTWDDGEDE